MVKIMSQYDKDLARCLKCKYFDRKNTDCTYDGICVDLDEKKEVRESEINEQ